MSENKRYLAKTHGMNAEYLEYMKTINFPSRNNQKMALHQKFDEQT